MSFYLMHRGWMDCPELQDRTPEPYTKREAWAWLIENAAFRETVVRIGCKTIKILRGQLSISLGKLAKLWLWDNKKVHRFFAKLSGAGMTHVCPVSAPARDTHKNIITICNYDRYQCSNVSCATTNCHEEDLDCQEMAVLYKEERIKEDKKESPSLRSGDAREPHEPELFECLPKREKNKHVRKSARRPLTADWEPNQNHYEIARELGYDERWVQRQAKIYRDTRNEKAIIVKDADAGFSGWIRRAPEFDASIYRTRSQNCRETPGSVAAAVSKALDYLEMVDDRR